MTVTLKDAFNMFFPLGLLCGMLAENGMQRFKRWVDRKYGRFSDNGS